MGNSLSTQSDYWSHDDCAAIGEDELLEAGTPNFGRTNRALTSLAAPPMGRLQATGAGTGLFNRSRLSGTTLGIAMVPLRAWR